MRQACLDFLSPSVGRAMGLRVVDLTMPIESLKTPVFPGYPQPLKTMYTVKSIHGYNSNVWVFVEHTGTHVDAPRHFFDEGDTIDKRPLENYVGWATVLDFSDVPPGYEIKREDIEERIKRLDFSIGKEWILLFYTGYSGKAGTSEWLNHPILGEEACKYLLDLGVKAVGFDAPSPDREPFPAHSILLPRGVAIFENLANLEKLVGKKFLFVGAPLKLVEGTASPVRALAIIFEK